MLQLAQNPKSGAVELVEVPTPVCREGSVVVKTLASVVSAGTERNTIKLGRNSLIRTALERRDLAGRVANKLRTDGLAATLRTIRDRRQQRTALGYSSCGEVVEVGAGVDDLKVGDLVACAGAEFASHAELVCVPRRLVAAAPEGVKPEQAAFTTIGAIALQGVRLAKVQLGENVAVIGLGLLGQLTVQLLVAAGCRVLAVDLDPQRVELARQSGAHLAVTADRAERAEMNGLLMNGRGWDCVLITADSSSSRPLEMAARLARDKGRVVLVGLVKTELPRHDFYAKELEFVVSRSTGPGRYDPNFELGGIDYPYSYVRWTETRNMEAFLQLLEQGKISVEHLITHRFPFREDSDAYRLLLNKESSLGIVFEYPADPVRPAPQVHLPLRRRRVRGLASGSIGLIGAGSFARGVLLPHILKQGFRPAALATQRALSARTAAEKFGFETICNSAEELLAREDIETVFIATPHATHAALVCRALEAGKHVFVEKPLAITREELQQVRSAMQSASALLMVGFNRRFSPFAQYAKRLLARSGGDFTFHYRVNAGGVPEQHWIRNPQQGGRVIGEVCHFIDLMTFLADAPLDQVFATAGAYEPEAGKEDVQLSLRFENGCNGTVSYVTTNRAPLAKERLEIWANGLVIELDDFRQLWVSQGRRERTVRRRRQAKGHQEEVHAFRVALDYGGPPPIPFEDLARTTLATIEALESLRTGVPYHFPSPSQG